MVYESKDLSCPRRAICKRDDRISSKSWATVLPKAHSKNNRFTFLALPTTPAVRHRNTHWRHPRRGELKNAKNQFVKPKNSGIACQTRKDYYEQFQFFEPKRVCLLFEVKEPTGVRSVMNDRQELRILRRQINKASFCVTSYLG
ncbi:hypothetical protein CEXT_447421 [Caerostris extrusa]|uniref:Ribosomal protein S10 n=1 Tax=Caerostris extrusa TaxID=172846 RepID=A0AAV4PE91_CAEEX|nr:hypothetical protein CEXT_447421 [Caerostris extrusa]